MLSLGGYNVPPPIAESGLYIEKTAKYAGFGVVGSTTQFGSQALSRCVAVNSQTGHVYWISEASVRTRPQSLPSIQYVLSPTALQLNRPPRVYKERYVDGS